MRIIRKIINIIPCFRNRFNEKKKKDCLQKTLNKIDNDFSNIKTKLKNKEINEQEALEKTILLINDIKNGNKFLK